MPFQITWSRRERVKWKRERLKEKGGEGGAGMRDEEGESEIWIAGGTASNSSNCASGFLQSQHMAD